MFHFPCLSPMKLQKPMATVKALLGDNLLKNECGCGVSGTLGGMWRDNSTQVGSIKEEELQKCEVALGDLLVGAAGGAEAECANQNVKILPCCFQDDLKNGLSQADCYVVKMMSQIMGRDWLHTHADSADHNAIERVLV